MEKIEITPEMVAAGEEALSQYFSFELDDAEKLVCAVFSAMAEASEAATVAPSHGKNAASG